MKQYSLLVRGKYKEWSFPIYAEPQHVRDWQEDGLELDELLYVVPQWVASVGLTGLWMKIKDIITGVSDAK